MESKQSRKGGGCHAPELSDLRPRTVERWTASLPLGHLDEVGRRLLEALRQVRGRRVDHVELFGFLDAIGPAMALTLDHLEGRCLHQALPLDRGEKEASRTALELTTGMVRGWSTLLRRRESSPWPWRRLVARRRRAVALHRIFHYAEAFFRLHHALHLALPDGFWRRLHRCFLVAEGEGLCDTTVTRSEGGGSGTTVGHVYRRLLLVAMVPGSLSAKRQTEMRINLDHWAALAVLHAPGAAAASCLHRIDLDSDGGVRPMVPREELSGAARGFDTGKLGRRLLELSVGHSDPGFLKLLHDAWCTAQKRNEPRRRLKIAAEVVVGLESLCIRAGGKAESRAPLFIGGGALPVVAEEPHAGVSAARVASVMAQLLDRSESGASLILPPRAAQRLAPGMPLAVRVHGEDWRLGVIARLRRRAGEIEVGAWFHLCGLLPGRLRGSGVDAPFFSVVLGRTAEGWAVMAPAVPSLRNGEALLEAGGRGVRLRRGTALCQSRHVEIFAIRGGVGVKPSVERRSAAPKPSVAPSPPPKAFDRDARIRQLIASTGLGPEEAAFVADGEQAANS